LLLEAPPSVLRHLDLGGSGELGVKSAVDLSEPINLSIESGNLNVGFIEKLSCSCGRHRDRSRVRGAKKVIESSTSVTDTSNSLRRTSYPSSDVDVRIRYYSMWCEEC